MIGRQGRRHSSDDSTRTNDKAPPSPFLGTGPERLRFYALVLFLALCALGGGASRPDVLSLLYLRPAAIICLLVLVLTPGGFEFRRFRFLFLLLGLFAGTMALQLIPLPPDLWLSLPGHARFAEGAAAAGMPMSWRPLSLTPDMTLNSLLALLPPLVVLVGIAAIREDQRRALLLVLICIACADAIWSVVQFASGANSPTYLYAVTNQGAPVGLFSNRNHHAILAALAFPMLALWLRMPSRNRQHLRTRRWMAVAIGMFLIPVILVAGSRAGVILGAVGILLAVLLAPRSREPRGRWDKWARAALLLVPIALIVVTIFASRAISLERFAGSDANATEVRVESLPTLLQMTRDFLPQGTGFGAFDPAFRIYESDAVLGPTYFNHAHNDLIELALTGGIPAVLVLFIFLGWWLARGGRWIARDRSPLLSSWFARHGALLVLMLLGASLVDYPLRTPLIACVFTIACAWLSLAFPTEEQVALPDEGPPRRGNAGRHAVAILLAAGFGWVAMGVTAAQTIGQRSPSWVLSWWPFDAEARASAANQLLQTRRPSRQTLDEAAALARRALEREPGNVGAVRALALASAMRGQSAQAERLMHFAESLSRRDLPTQLWLIEANVQRNDIEGALRHYDRALRTSLLAGEVLYPVLIQASANADVMGPVARIVGARPVWWTDFARKLVAESRSPAAIATIIGALRLDPRIEPERDLLIAAFNRLVQARAYLPAFTLYRRATRLDGNSPALILRNGDFQGENPMPPFDWALTDQSDLSARIEAPSGGGEERAMIVSARSGTRGEVARQFIVLSPGAYRLTARVGNVVGEEHDLPQIVLTCASGPQALFDLRWPITPPAGRAISQDFAVSPDCQAQWLSIRANAPLNGNSAESWIDSIAIQRRP